MKKPQWTILLLALVLCLTCSIVTDSYCKNVRNETCIPLEKAITSGLVLLTTNLPYSLDDFNLVATCDLRILRDELDIHMETVSVPGQEQLDQLVDTLVMSDSWNMENRVFVRKEPSISWIKWAFASDIPAHPQHNHPTPWMILTSGKP